MTKIRSYRIDEVHDDMEETLLDLDPCSDDAAKLRNEIEQLKHTDPDMQRYLEQREIYAMRARQFMQGEKQVIVLNLTEAKHRRARLIVSLKNCPPGSDREKELNRMIRELDNEIDAINQRDATAAAQRIHNGGQGQT